MAALQTQMKQAVALAATDQGKNGMVLGLGSGSTAALMIQEVGARLKDGRLSDIVGVTTSFQGEVLAAELGIPLQSLNAIDRIDLASMVPMKWIPVLNSSKVVAPATFKKSWWHAELSVLWWWLTAPSWWIGSTSASFCRLRCWLVPGGRYRLSFSNWEVPLNCAWLSAKLALWSPTKATWCWM